jgi:hypothetical protein
MGIGVTTGTIVLITIRTITITAISESTPACTAAAIDPGDGEVGGDRGRSPHWIKVKNPNAPAVKREAEADWAK